MEKLMTESFSRFLTSLSTTGLILVSFTIIIFALSKFGVFAKLLDKINMNQKVPKYCSERTSKVDNKIDRLLENDEDIKGRLTTMERVSEQHTHIDIQTAALLEKLSSRLTQLESSFSDYRQESFKRMVFNEHDLLIDRMAVGLKYLIDGGNGETRKYLLEQLAYEDLVIWNGLCKALNANQFWVHEKEEINNIKPQFDMKSAVLEGTGHYGIQL